MILAVVIRLPWAITSSQARGEIVTERNQRMLSNLKIQGKGLEIGPSFSPICPKSKGYNIEIIDHLSKEELIKKYVDDPNAGKYVDNIEEVDYVWDGRPYSQLIGRTGIYDFIIASHVIEHCVDLIEFLTECSKLLKEDGTLSLAVPDKRYTFDYFREVSSIRTVIDGNRYRMHKSHSLGTLIDSYFNTVAFDRGGVYMPDSAYLLEENLIYQKDIEKMRKSIDVYHEDDYIDCHSWVFTPASFQLLIYQMNSIGLINLYVDELYKAPESIEFLVKLKKGKVNFQYETLLKIQLERQKEFKQANSYDLNLPVWVKGKKIYIYGAGKRALRIVGYLKALEIELQGFIVSDDQPISRPSLCDKPIHHISEISPESENLGIVLGVSEEFHEEVMKVLERNGMVGCCFRVPGIR